MIGPPPPEGRDVYRVLLIASRQAECLFTDEIHDHLLFKDGILVRFALYWPWERREEADRDLHG